VKPFSFVDNFKIRSKLIAMCIIVIVPVFAASIFLIINIVRIQQENAVNEAFSSADRLKTRLSDMIYMTTNVSERVFANDSIMSFIKDEHTSESEFNKFYSTNNTLNEYLTAYSQISYIKFYINKDFFVYNSQFRQATFEIQQKAWYQNAVQNKDKVLWDITESPSDKRLYLSLIKAIFNDNKCIGVMVIAINPKWIENMMNDDYNMAVFSVNDYKAFYSNIESIKTGDVVNSLGFEKDAVNVRECVKHSITPEKAYTIIETFQYENTGNIFQVFLIKPYSQISSVTNSVTKVYVWYMCLCFSLSVLLSLLLAIMFSKRVQYLKNQMHNVANGDFNMNYVVEGNDEITELYYDLEQMVKSMQKLINEAYQAKLQTETFKVNQMEAEFKTLASQINPHFLYNTLETIRMKAYCNNDKETADLIKKLGKFMRRCLDVKYENVSLESELEFTKSYLELQSARFGDRISYSIYSEVSRDYRILPLIIQPIVENAFVHGIESSKTNGHISIKVTYVNNNVIITVKDNGQGISEEKMAVIHEKLEKSDTSSGKSIGLTNVNKRIKMYHGDEYGLKIFSKENEGTTVQVILPGVIRSRDVNDEIC
jgi:two-component system sensor histidine kinase YesM